MLLAVPATMRIADSTVKQFKSGILSSAIAFTWSQVISATLLRLGCAEPLLSLAASLSWTATGGGLDYEVEALVSVVGDYYREHLAGFVLGAGIELLAKLHDVDALGTQCRAYWGRRVCSAAFDL